MKQLCLSPLIRHSLLLVNLSRNTGQSTLKNAPPRHVGLGTATREKSFVLVQHVRSWNWHKFQFMCILHVIDPFNFPHFFPFLLHLFHFLHSEKKSGSVFGTFSSCHPRRPREREEEASEHLCTWDRAARSGIFSEASSTSELRNTKEDGSLSGRWGWLQSKTMRWSGYTSIIFES